MEKSKIYIFWDNSNIFISAKRFANNCRVSSSYGLGTRIHFENLYNLAKVGRDVEKIIVVGSVLHGEAELWRRFESTIGCEIKLFEKGNETGKEQAVDQALQVEMLRALNDEKVPQIAVLLTGDGAGYDEGIGFHADLERMYNSGWGVEVISWKNTCKQNLENWVKKAGVFIDLEEYFDSVTYEVGGRPATKLNMKHRGQARIANKFLKQIKYNCKMRNYRKNNW